jgi:hypothetical protein
MIVLASTELIPGGVQSLVPSRGALGLLGGVIVARVLVAVSA